MQLLHSSQKYGIVITGNIVLLKNVKERTLSKQKNRRGHPKIPINTASTHGRAAFMSGVSIPEDATEDARRRLERQAYWNHKHHK
jgi:hypothetical protein